MKCPNCHADSTRQRIMTEGKRQCSVCATIWSLNENGGIFIVKNGQTFLAEVTPTTQCI